MSYNYDTSHNSPNYTPAASAPGVFGMPRIIEGITIHHWGDPAQNPQFASVRDYLSRANGNTSAHFVATGTDRQVACIVNPGDVAWHSGSAWGNARTIGIELDPRARDEDYDVAAELIADIRSAYGDVPIYWHSYFTATSCPGVWNPERLDVLSYTKFSAAEWGQGGNKVQAPIPEPTPSPEPVVTVLWKLLVNKKQVAAYSTEANAFAGYGQYGKVGVTISYDGKDVTDAIVAKYTAPSPTATQPDSGKPVVDKDDYEETKARVGVLEAIVQKIVDFLTSIFSGFKKG